MGWDCAAASDRCTGCSASVEGGGNLGCGHCVLASLTGEVVNAAGGAAACRREACHSGGQWMELAVSNAADESDCMNKCQLHPEATAMQYKPGSCACLALGDGVVFQDAINGIHMDDDDRSCTICDLSVICHKETCHNDGHWIEVDFPLTLEISGCQRQCMLHDEATGFQYNDDGWCGCLVLADDVEFADAIVGENIHDSVSACTVCDINIHRNRVPAPPPPVCTFAWNEDADESCNLDTGACAGCYPCFMYDNSQWGGSGSGTSNHQGSSCGCIDANEDSDDGLPFFAGHCRSGYTGCSGCTPACDHCVAPAPPPPNVCEYAWNPTGQYTCAGRSEGGADMKANGANDGSIAQMELFGLDSYGGICFELCYECWLHDNSDWGGEGCGCFEDDPSGAACVPAARARISVFEPCS